MSDICARTCVCCCNIQQRNRAKKNVPHHAIVTPRCVLYDPGRQHVRYGATILPLRGVSSGNVFLEAAVKVFTTKNEHVPHMPHTWRPRRSIVSSGVGRCDHEKKSSPISTILHWSRQFGPTNTTAEVRGRNSAALGYLPCHARTRFNLQVGVCPILLSKELRCS